MVGPWLKVILATTTLAVIAVGFVYSESLMSGQGPGETLSSSSMVSSSSTVTSFATSTSSLIRTSSAAVSQGPTGVILRLSFDKAAYSGGGIAAVTVSLENNGARPVTVDDPEVSPQLVVYDSAMNQVGTWARLQKAQEMNPPSGPLVLATGEKYSWTLQWSLAVTPPAGGGQTGLPPGQYLVKAALQAGVGVPASYGQLTSDLVPVIVG
jgi:hypothetical protein